MGAIEALGELLRRAGAVAFGVAPAGLVPPEEWERFQLWLSKGFHAGMTYMENYPEIRRDPRLLLPGALSIVSVAFNYRQPNPFKGVATYALGEDYHKVLRRRLKPVVGMLRERFGGDWRICIDSAPVLERYWAVRSGTGHRSPFHGNIVVPGVGSMVFLAEIVTSLELPEFSRHFYISQAEVVNATAHGNRAIQTVCPTSALQPDGTVDSRRCINYLTIERRGDPTPEETALIGSAIFGCDACQRVCPENRGPLPEILQEFQPLPYLKEFLSGKPVPFPIEKSPMKRKRPTTVLSFVPSGQTQG